MRFNLLRWIFPLCYLLTLSPFLLHGSETGLPQKGKVEQVTSPVVVKLLSEEGAVQASHPFWVGVELKMAEGWDTYWVNPGDAGFPTKVEWHLPPGFTAGPLHWPTPEKFVSQSLVGFGYTDSVLLLAQITPPADLGNATDVQLNANVSWLACKEQCVPGSAQVSLSLPTTTSAPQKDEAMQKQFAEARGDLPQVAQGALTAGTKEKEIVLNFKPQPGQFKEISEASFIPESGEMIDYLAPQQLQKTGEGLYTLNLKRANPESALPSHVKGILLVSEKGDPVQKSIQVDTPMLTATASPVGHEGINFPIALSFAFLGGLILNVMPCVLPVIALKIFSFVKMSGQKRSTIFKHGVAFAFGVLGSFWILSVLLLILKGFGHGLGWGFQLQEPLFVVALTIILFVLALSLFGVFEMGTSLISLGNKSKLFSNPFASSLLSGVLATLVATPCTGPLLGPALGFAMTLPAASCLLIFTMMGLGMASPYLLFSAFPQLVRFLPKPGDWMVVFKQLMGFLMMATCLWLLWVFAAQTSEMALFILLGSLLLISIGGWIYGHFATPLRKKGVRMVASLLAAVIIATGSTSAVMTAKSHKTAKEQVVVSQNTDKNSDWQAYSPAKVEELRKEGTPVFVDFTAKWCLICQANKVILHSSDIQKAFAQKGVVTMTADWTKKDATTTEALKHLGRSGVPVYVLYSGDPQDAPFILPQTLTGSIVNDYLNKLKTTPHETVQHEAP